MSWIRYRIRHSQIMAQRRSLTGVASRWPTSHSWFSLYRRKAAWAKRRDEYLYDTRRR